MRNVWMTLLGILVFATPSMAGDKGVMGALLGAGIGAGIGHAVDRSGGSGKGAAIGAVGGYLLGHQMDKSDQRARDYPARQQTPAPAPVQTSAPPPVQAPIGGSRLTTQNCTQGHEYLDRSSKTKNNDDKVYYLEKAVKLCPGDARAHNDLGVAYYTRSDRHDRDRAKVEFQEALKINPNYDVARDNLNSL